jgi:hypothetical protein
MEIKPFYLLTAFALATFSIHAQTNSSATDTSIIIMNSTESRTSENRLSVNNEDRIPFFNLIKLNLTGILLKNYSLQYERVLNKKISIALQYRIMPETSIPFKSSILKVVGDDDPDTKKIIEDFRMSNYAITPEVRFYLSKKGYGRGFYIAPFYRYASFTSNDFNVFYTDDNNVEQSVKMSGKLTSNTGGILIGAQKDLGEHVVLDISFFGPHYGSGKGDFRGTTSQPLTADEQNDLREQLEDIDIPFTDKTVNVNANGASLKLDGPWGGYRFALSLGVRF